MGTSRTPSFLPQNPVFSNVDVKTGGSVDVFNTADRTTNYEKLAANWVSNAANILTTWGGTGVPRVARFGTTSTADSLTPSRYIEVGKSDSAIMFQLAATSAVVNGTMVAIPSGATMTTSSGVNTALSVAPTVIGSGTAGYTAIDVNPTESSTGSGTKLLQRWAVGGSEKAKISNAGAMAVSILRVGSLNFSNEVFQTSGIATGATALTTNETLNSGHSTRLCDATAGALTVTLPAASVASGRIYTIKKVDSSGNTVTIDANASETIDGALTKVLSAQYASLTIQCDGTGWHVL